VRKSFLLPRQRFRQLEFEIRRLRVTKVAEAVLKKSPKNRGDHGNILNLKVKDEQQQKF
jgi:hypothetical protein